MNCPSCEYANTYVSRTLPPEPDKQRRIRRCVMCGCEFSTTEYPDSAELLRQVRVAEVIGHEAQQKVNALRFAIERSLT